MSEARDVTADTDPALEEHRELIGFLRENANDLGIGVSDVPE